VAPNNNANAVEETSTARPTPRIRFNERINKSNSKRGRRLQGMYNGRSANRIRKRAETELNMTPIAIPAPKFGNTRFAGTRIKGATKASKTATIRFGAGD
jgi:hypothetical protein